MPWKEESAATAVTCCGGCFRRALGAATGTGGGMGRGAVGGTRRDSSGETVGGTARGTVRGMGRGTVRGTDRRTVGRTVGGMVEENKVVKVGTLYGNVSSSGPTRFRWFLIALGFPLSTDGPGGARSGATDISSSSYSSSKS